MERGRGRPIKPKGVLLELSHSCEDKPIVWRCICNARPVLHRGERTDSAKQGTTMG